MSNRTSFLIVSAAAIFALVIFNDISQPERAEAGILIRGSISPNIRPTRARFYRTRSTSEVLRATNPVLNPRFTESDEIKRATKEQQRYYRKLLQWHRKQVQYERKAAQLKRKQEAKAQKEAERRRRAYARMLRNSDHPVAGKAPSGAVAVDPREWFTQKIARRNPFASDQPAPTAPPSAAGKSAKGIAPTENKPDTGGDFLKSDRPGREIKGNEPHKKENAGIWFHIKRALGLV